MRGGGAGDLVMLLLKHGKASEALRVACEALSLSSLPGGGGRGGPKAQGPLPVSYPMLDALRLRLDAEGREVLDSAVDAHFAAKA